VAKMITLNPVPSVPLPAEGWTLIATDAGRYAPELLATLHARNGTLQTGGQLPLAHRKQWASFVEEVATLSGCATEAITEAITQLTEAIEVLLRPRPRTLGEAAAPHPADAGADALPWIDAQQANLRIVTADAWEALQKANTPVPQYFRYGGELVRLERDDEALLYPAALTTDRLRHELARLANWYVMDEETQARRVVKPPADVVRDVLATPNPPLPVLRRLVEIPVFGRDGTLQTEPGYHPASRTYYQPVAGFCLEAVPEHPSTEDITFARTLILGEVLTDFPFVDAADRAHAVGLWLQPVCRDLIDGPTPMHLIEAPGAGSGKGLLAEVCLFPSVGHRIGTLSAGRDEEEWRKSITTVLRRGHEAVWIDNITQPLKSGDLAAALTSPMWEDRILGQSTAVRLPVRCTWLATANNPLLSEELTRRAVRIRIDPKVDRPWLREGFRHKNLREWVHAHRGPLVWAALTLVRAWIAAARPHPQAKPFGSYESWSRTIGGILEVAGIDGFLGNLTEFYDAANTEAAAWWAFVTAWWERHQHTPVTAKELLPLALQFDELDIAGKDERGQVRSLGRKLGGQRDRVIDTYRLISGSQDRTHVGRWRLDEVG
jgi:putative DNA primase/helicase